MDEIRKCLADGIGNAVFENKNIQIQKIQELRLRKGQPLWIRTWEDSGFLHIDGTVGTSPENGRIVTGQELKATISKLSAYSLYAFEEELRQGFLTIEGGHRVGFCGKAVWEKDRIRTLAQISSLNIRVAREVYGCADRILPYLIEEGRFLPTVIVSPPGCGKTTVLREIVRQISSGFYGSYLTVGVADERGEISGMRNGSPQMNLGYCTDVIYGCPKGEGMEMLLRSMAPDIIAVDELGGMGEYTAVENMVHGGVGLLCTAHGGSMEDLQKRPCLCAMMKRDMIKRFVFLSTAEGAGTVERIQDDAESILYERKKTREAKLDVVTDNRYCDNTHMHHTHGSIFCPA